LLLFGTLAGVLQVRSGPGIRWEVFLAVLGAVVLFEAVRLRRPLDFAIAVAAFYVGLLRAIFAAVLWRSPTSLALVIALSSIAALAVLLVGTKRLRSER